MAAIRHSLQRDVFEPTEERLVGVLYVTKPGKKKKTSFLCATINKEKPIYATIHQVSYNDYISVLYFVMRMQCFLFRENRHLGQLKYSHIYTLQLTPLSVEILGGSCLCINI